MDAWWIAPVVALGLAGVALVLAGATARRSSRSVAAERPGLEAVATELRALQVDLERVADRVDRHPGGAGAGTTAR